jgi:hypothetical protein
MVFSVLIRTTISRVLVVISSTEFYSVPAADIFPPDRAYTGLPQRIWVARGSEVWRCQQAPLNVQRAEHVNIANLPSLIDTHLSTQHPALADLLETSAPPLPRPLTTNERCFLKNYSRYYLTPAKLFAPLSEVLAPGGEPISLRPLFYEWAVPCLETRPPEDTYLTRFNTKNIHTLAGFIKEFGKTLGYFE